VWLSHFAKEYPMNTRCSLGSLVLLLCLLLNIASSASAQILYENGPINGEELSWTINYGFYAADSFTIVNPNTLIGGFSFGAWLFPGDVLESAEVSISSNPLSGTYYFDGIVHFTASGCFDNGSFNVCAETGQFNGPTLDAGTYWLNLQNAVSADGNPVYWDENNGVGCHSLGCPSQAVDSSLGTIPSESFSIVGSQGSTGTTPEPVSLVLFASGGIGIIGWIRRYRASD
jgi:hypothetical protein